MLPLHFLSLILLNAKIVQCEEMHSLVGLKLKHISSSYFEESKAKTSCVSCLWEGRQDTWAFKKISRELKLIT